MIVDLFMLNKKLAPMSLRMKYMSQVGKAEDWDRKEKCKILYGTLYISVPYCLFLIIHPTNLTNVHSKLT